jgi:hypothetical protein
MAYVAESYFGDKLSLYMLAKENGIYEVEIRKNANGNASGGDVVARCLLVFE